MPEAPQALSDHPARDSLLTSELPQEHGSRLHVLFVPIYPGRVRTQHQGREQRGAPARQWVDDAQVPPGHAAESAGVPSNVQQELRDAEVASDSTGFRVVGDRSFILRDGTWTDTRYLEGMAVQQVLFASPRYFQLLEEHPDWGRCLALGSDVLIVAEGQAYHLGPQGDSQRVARQPLTLLEMIIAWMKKVVR